MKGGSRANKLKNHLLVSPPECNIVMTLSNQHKDLIMTDIETLEANFFSVFCMFIDI